MTTAERKLLEELLAETTPAKDYIAPDTVLMLEDAEPRGRVIARWTVPVGAVLPPRGGEHE